MRSIHQLINIGYIDPSKSNSWKVLETVSSHIKFLKELSRSILLFFGLSFYFAQH